VRKNEITAESLAQVLISNDLCEIEYEEDGRRIYMSRHMTRSADIPPVVIAPASQTPDVEAHTQEVNWRNHPGAVLSPMVGVAYMSPEPGAEPFVRVGSMVSQGQILLLIEAMKVLNPIKASKGGKIVAILVNDQKPVEYNEPLMVIAE
jgi:acetyl-CoA carboxylase biotin carboxyl carrier protein